MYIYICICISVYVYVYVDVHVYVTLIQFGHAEFDVRGSTCEWSAGGACGGCTGASVVIDHVLDVTSGGAATALTHVPEEHGLGSIAVGVILLELGDFGSNTIVDDLMLCR